MYNFKILNFPNGTTQIRYYSKPIISDEDIDIFNPLDWHDCGHDWEHIDQEFSNFYVPEKKNEDTTIEQDCKYLELKSIENANRAKSKLYEYSRSYQWEWFVTWTFSNKYVDRFSYDECSSKIRKWLNNQTRASPQLKYLVVPEKHKNGAWHFHGLVSNAIGMEIVDSGHKVGEDKIYNIKGFKYGFTTATKVKDVYRVSLYIGKYITKSLIDQTKGKQRYFVSKNLPKPLETRIMVNDEVASFDDVIKQYCNEHDMNIVYSKVVSSQYRDISYIELNYKE